MPMRSDQRPLSIRAFALLTAAAVLGCTASGVTPGSPGPVGRPAAALPTAGSDTVTLAMLEHELTPAPETSTFTVVASHDLGTGPVMRLTELRPADTAAAPYLRIALLRPSADARDLLDSAAAGFTGVADVLVTRDPTVLEYARARFGPTAEPLPWDRLHAAVIVDPARTRIAASADLRGALARDAVRADARAAQPPYTWETRGCEGTATRDRAPAPQVAYRRDDAVARDLAERLVAIDGTVTAAALPSDSFAMALADGAHAVYLVALPIATDEGDWCGPLPELPAGALVVPLVETRAHAIVRAGTPPLVLAPGVPLRYAPQQTAPPDTSDAPSR